MIIHFIILVVGFVVLVKGADWLVNGSVSLAKRYRVSELVIGLTVVAFGTSSPELVVNIFSSLQGHNDVTVGNIIGSNLFNLMLILGISGLIYPFIVQVKTVRNEIPLSFIAALMVLVLANDSIFYDRPNRIGIIDGIILLLLFILFMAYIFHNFKEEKITQNTSYKLHSLVKTLVLISIGLLALIVGSKIVVEKAIKIAQFLGASEKLIGLTIVSVGTSLPELVTSVVAAARKRIDIAVGNVIGSNIFNIFLVLGISAVISPINYNTLFNFDLWVLCFSTILLFGAMFSGHKFKLDRWEAALLSLGYIVFIIFMIYEG